MVVVPETVISPETVSFPVTATTVLFATILFTAEPSCVTCREKIPDFVPAVASATLDNICAVKNSVGVPSSLLRNSILPASSLSAPSPDLLFMSLKTGPVASFPSFIKSTTGFCAVELLIIKLGVFASTTVVAITLTVGALSSVTVDEFICARVSVFTTKLLSASIVISKVLVLVSAEGEIKVILPSFFTPFPFSIMALVFSFTLSPLLKNSLYP